MWPRNGLKTGLSASCRGLADVLRRTPRRGCKRLEGRVWSSAWFCVLYTVSIAGKSAAACGCGAHGIHLKKARVWLPVLFVLWSKWGIGGANLATWRGVPGRRRRPKWGGCPNTARQSWLGASHRARSAARSSRCACDQVLSVPSARPSLLGGCPQSGGNRAA